VILAGGRSYRARGATLLALSAIALPVASARAAGVVGTGTPVSCTEAALDQALSGGGTVTFNCGGGPVAIPITTTKLINLTATIDGAGQQVALDGGGTTRLFLTQYTFSQFSLTLRNLTIRNGHAPDYGGAIRLAFQEASRPFTLTIDNVTFADNVCDALGGDVGGGAIYALGGILNISNSVFSGNRGGNGGAIGSLQARFTISDTVFSGNATNPRDGGGNGGHGGAIYIDGSSLGTLVIQRSTFTANSASNLGGAIHTYMYGLPSAMTIDQTTFANNAGTTNGGAIFHMNGALTVTASTFSGNTVVGQGGGLWVTDGGGGTPVAITNSTFTGNQATGTRPNSGSVGLGGAITNSGASSFTVTHATIVGNHADWVGGGIVSGAGNTTLKNSIVANNSAANGGNPWNIQQNCSNTMGDGGGNIQWPNLNPSDGNDRRCAAGVTFAEPNLGGLAANGGLTETMALKGGSPALEAGVGCPPPATDQRGVARPQGAACDAGAFESRPIADLSITKTDGGASPAPGQALGYTIVARNNGPAAVTGAAVSDSFPASLTGVSWTCAASPGSSCPPSGSGSINPLVTLNAAGTATYTVNATVPPSAVRVVANTASIATPAGFDDPNLADNTASVVTPLARPLALHTVSPCRIVDTRGAAGPVGGPVLAAGASRTFPVIAHCAIPSTAWAVAVNVTVTGATAAGNLRVYPAGTPVPLTSTLNYGANQTRGNNATVSLGPAGDLAVFCSQATGSAHFILDVSGYFE
jgi:uncharacterized repeat protein (TIGR01451 family)